MAGVNPIFTGINVDPLRIAQIIQPFVIQGSARHNVAATDLNIVVLGDIATNDITLEQLLAAGTKFFDAVMYLSIPPAARLEPHRSEGEEEEIDWDQIARDLFYTYFLLLTQARAPTQNVYVGAFLINVLGLSDDPVEVANRLATFELNRMDHSWIRHIDLSHLSVEARNRLALGTAGYRLPQAVTYGTPDAVYNASFNVSQEEWNKTHQRAIEVREMVANWIGTGLMWYAHPTTRDPLFITRFKSMNKNLTDMLCWLFKRETLNSMVTQKVIYAHPTLNPRERGWINWTADMFDFTPAPIFPAV